MENQVNTPREIAAAAVAAAFLNHPEYVQQGAQFAQFPPIIGVDLLSVLLDKTPASIFADRCRAPEKLPPSYRAPGAKAPRWITAEVISWLKDCQEDLTVKPVIAAGKRGVGRPRKTATVKQEGGAA